MTSALPVVQPVLIHGTTVALGSHGILLRGASGAGKSDLALRFIADQGRFPCPKVSRRLVSDDQTLLTRDGDRLMASSPAAIEGMLEVRGVGIVRVPKSDAVAVSLVVDLVDTSEIERMPELLSSIDLLGRAVPCRKLWAFEASAALKLAMLTVDLIGYDNT